jgi:hypothetical protein
MIYAIATIACLVFWKLCDLIANEIEEDVIQAKKKFAIPAEFWDDYNKAEFFIDRMGINEVSRTQYMVDDIIMKYHECLDYNTFTERISLLIEKIEAKKRSFLLIDSLN